MTNPPPIPVPMVNIITSFSPRPAPYFASPHAAAFASFSITIDNKISFLISLCKFTPFHPAIFGAANIVWRSDETKPAAEIPTAAISFSGYCAKSS